MIGMTNGFGTIYTDDRVLATFETSEEIIVEDEDIIIIEGCE